MINGVTVYCLTYNHKNYIEKTLEGFVNQKVDFPYKVIVHDDASTDGTQEIIKFYEKKYPQIICPIFQNENQYSKNTGIYKEHIRPLIDTKYTAICEGDDYWSDNNKLQLQYDYMENNPKCSLCVHNTEMINENGISINKLFNSNELDLDYYAEDVIGNGPGGLFHTSSFFYRTELRDARPREFIMRYVGDYPLAIYFSCNGYVHYIGRVMSKYRVGSVNSWVKLIGNDKSKKMLHIEDEIQSLIRMDSYMEQRYHCQFQKIIDKDKFEKSVLEQGLVKTLNNHYYRKIFRNYPFKLKLKHILYLFNRRG